MPVQRCKFQISLNYAAIRENVVSGSVVLSLKLLKSTEMLSPLPTVNTY